jgi:TRAP-type uncharacterized transport system substrate-binding protein
MNFHDDKIVYIAKLFNLEEHVVVAPIERLQGQRVNLDELGSGTNYSMREVFKRLGIRSKKSTWSKAWPWRKSRRAKLQRQS